MFLIIDSNNTIAISTGYWYRLNNKSMVTDHSRSRPSLSQIHKQTS